MSLEQLDTSIQKINSVLGDVAQGGGLAQYTNGPSFNDQNDKQRSRQADIFH